MSGNLGIASRERDTDAGDLSRSSRTCVLVNGNRNQGSHDLVGRAASKVNWACLANESQSK